MQRKPTLTDVQVADLREAFAVFDQDGNGTITSTELEALMSRVLGGPVKNQVEDIIKSVDFDGSGTIDFDEFLTLMSDPKFSDLAKDEHRQAFDMFDKDGNGQISVTELKESFRSLGQKLTDDEFDAILREADLDGNSHIDYEEFLQMMKL